MCGEESYFIGADPDDQRLLIWVCPCGAMAERGYKTLRSARAALQVHQKSDPQQ